RPILEDAIERARERAAAAHVALALDVKEVSMLPAHAEQLTVALDALLDNAVRASSSGSQVVVQATTSDDDVCINVIDRGMGMSPEVARRAVEIGYSTWGGSGIGLTIAKFIIYHHAGGFQVSSAPNKGTTVTLLLPSTEVRE